MGFDIMVRMTHRSLALLIGLSGLLAAAVLPFRVMPADQVKRVAVVFTSSEAAVTSFEAAFWIRMRELGWVEGKNVVAVNRYAGGNPDRLPSLIAEVLSGGVDVLVAPGNQGAVAARTATATIPIVGIFEPGTGLVASLARPGGNLTGLSNQYDELSSKWMELVRETVPGVSTVAVIVNPDNPTSTAMLRQITRAAATLGLKHIALNVRRAEDYAGAIKEARRRAQAAIVTPDALSVHSREAIAQLTQKYRLPALAWTSEFAEAGVLMAYGSDQRVIWGRVAEYVDKILKGASPADLPIQQPTEFRLSINLKTAKAFGLSIPESVLLRADEVIR